MLPPTIPIFPLPGAVLFPNVFLPLHIFEPRYRTMVSEALDGDRASMRTARRRLEALLVPQPEGRGAEPKVPPTMPDEDLVNALAQYLELEPVEKQALLERESLLSRCESLIELLEMKVIVAKHKWSGGEFN
jgi:Lon protease-like protein